MPAKEYLFRTHSNHIIQTTFYENTTIQEAIDFFTKPPYNFTQVRIYPIYNIVPNFTAVDQNTLLTSFNTNLFLLCARFHRNSLNFNTLPEISIEEYIDTPIPIQKCGEKEHQRSIILRDIQNMLNEDPSVFDSVLNLINKEEGEKVYKTMKAYRNRILYLIEKHNS